MNRRINASAHQRNSEARVSVWRRVTQFCATSVLSCLWLLAGLLLLAAAAAAAVLILRAGTTVSVTVDGYTETVRSTRPDVGRLLADLGLQLRPADRLAPAPETPLTPGLAITVDRDRPCLVAADSGLRLLYSHAATAGDLITEADIRLAPKDEIWLDGAQVALTTPLPARDGGSAPPKYSRGRAWAGHEPPEVRLTVRRAAPLTVDDGSVPFTIYTTAPTIGEALLDEGVALYLGDRVQPSLGSRVQAGLRVFIQRSKPVLVTADRRTVRTRTRGKTVGDTLVELGLMVAGSDRVTPALAAAVMENTQIVVVRVLETVLVDREPIPFQAILISDDELELDEQRLDQRGEYGEYRRRFKVEFEDGIEVSRALTDDWVAAQPITQVVAYGRKIISRPLETPAGVFSYWRKVRMLATSYSANTAGVAPTASYYGITRLGWPMRKGIVAVDPTVVALGSRVYVPGYGVGDAGDTGSVIRAKRIDLGYDDDNLVLWYRWVDVYLLDPPPPRSEVRWVLPNWPRE
ncbi:MAG: ubiquitin-like domain-containing protein [Chloroflexi bacterium]|nr:ubiquitin-like domain-containing protein [Chloroflexota bacterium]